MNSVNKNANTKHDKESTDDKIDDHLSDNELELFWSALMFYTRLRAPNNTPYCANSLNKSRKYFPFIGLIVAAIAVSIYLIGQSFFSNAIAIALSMVATILVTGAFHEDGFADSCDGFGGGWETEQVLTIMKDSRIGSYATIGLICLLGIKFLALLELSNISIAAFVFAYVAAHTLSRLASLLVIEQYDYVQDINHSKANLMTQTKLSSPDLHQTLIVSAIPLLVSMAVALIPTVIAAIACLLTAKLFAVYSKKRIGGYTGDILGAIQQLSEIAFYLMFIACL